MRTVATIGTLSWFAVGLVMLGGSEPGYSYQLQPTGTEDERIIVELKQGFLGRFWSEIGRYVSNHFKTNVHEEVTHRIWGCEPPANADAREDTCASSDFAPASVIYGVQWNDNPPFKLDSTNEDECTTNTPIRLPDRQPRCWLILFGDAAKKAARGEYFMQSNGMALVYRTHFGDLQFQHSMASWNGETMEDTKDNIMMWAEFTYRVSIGEISPQTKLSEIPVVGFRKFLGRYWGDVSTLFAFGVSRYQQDIPDVAFGSLLHMVQDSFSGSHVAREYPAGSCGNEAGLPNAGRVIAFLAYGSQDTGKHDKEDGRDAMLAGLRERPSGNVVVVGRYLKKLRDENTPWEVVRSYLDACVYFVAEDDLGTPAGPGAFRP